MLSLSLSFVCGIFFILTFIHQPIYEDNSGNFYPNSLDDMTMLAVML